MLQNLLLMMLPYVHHIKETFKIIIGKCDDRRRCPVVETDLINRNIALRFPNFTSVRTRFEFQKLSRAPHTLALIGERRTD